MLSCSFLIGGNLPISTINSMTKHITRQSFLHQNTVVMLVVLSDGSKMILGEMKEINPFLEDVGLDAD